MKKIGFILALMVSQITMAQQNFQNISIAHSRYMKVENGNYSLDANDEFKALEKKFTYNNLRIYMLRSNNTYKEIYKGTGNYTSLDEALKKKKINIFELGQASVNRLEVENISADTIMLLAGEVVLGGKQDRVLGQDVLLLPHSGRIQVDVFCVEHGRWTAQESGFQFTGTAGVVNGSIRKKAVVNKDQSGVWEKVAETNQKNEVQPATGTYNALQKDSELNAAIEKYIKYFEPLIYNDSNYIGFVAVTGSEVICADIFATNAMFRKHAPKLLKSAAIEAITNGALVAISGEKVMNFLSEILKDESTQEDNVKSNGALLKNGSKKIHFNYYKK